ncbi:glycosyltransferase family 2 protein [Nesterenkonia sp. LB17]|uniref:glycosyltransferase family A protein n=1 Tax=unclassified Nesterenkonia TaxID=2629769 RepID=UPI001F4CF9E8|nr:MULTISPECIES: glycosyltransferase family A protein [unclassified Nesterenkonia]MCH8563888.1 glycosyltransferase family 2 protein [Nesterenkonia sp. YGD6]MCH8566486.1 glycosyltransferase family 2 protein [Nesterenkonia sp. LB17]
MSINDENLDERAAPNTAPVTVSVVIPVKDDSAELTVCLAALAAQTRTADEIIVVDNASVDDSAAAARAAGATVLSCLQPGIPAASATGYDAATSDLILRLDADCVPEPRWIQDVVSAFEQQPHVAALTGPAKFIDGPVLLRRPLVHAYLFAYRNFSRPALGHRPLFGSNMAMRREAWEQVRLSVHRDDPEIHDDLDLAFHLGERHRLGAMGGEPMGISMRPFRDARAFQRRIKRGFRSVTVHWPHDFPPFRWRRASLRRRGHASESGRART